MCTHYYRHVPVSRRDISACLRVVLPHHDSIHSPQKHLPSAGKLKKKTIPQLLKKKKLL
jgi:hypothetical protein